MKKLAVIIPAYQAGQTIQMVLENMPEYIGLIIVVDDASKDDTFEKVKQVQLKNPKIHLLHHSANQGVGGAMLTGYKYAIQENADILIKIDSDGQMDAHYIVKLVQPIIDGSADFTKGNRFMHIRHLESMPPIRKLGNIGLSLLIKLASGYWNIFDPTNGFTAINANILKCLELENVDKRYFFESSMLLEMGIARAVVQDIFIPAKYGGEKSSLSIIDSLFRFPPKLLKGFIKRITLQYFIRDFSSTAIFMINGLIGVIFGFLFGIFHWYRSAKYNIPATTGTVMLAILPFILGIQLLLQTIISDIENVPNNPISTQINGGNIFEDI